MKLTRTAFTALLLLAGACRPPLAASAARARLAVVAPRLASPLSETYPAPASPSDPVKRAVFERINRDRTDAGLAPVAWDPGASRVADAFCERQVRERTRGHYLTDGLPPYARAALAGVFGYQSENSASWITTAPSFSETPVELALTAHAQMLAEKPPRDGHRMAILDPEATHVGVGWALSHGRFQMAQEFLARHLERLTLKTDPSQGVLLVEGATRWPMRLRFVTIAHEPPPRRLTQAEATARASYRYPAPTEAYIPEGYTMMRVVGAPTLDRIRLGRNRDFSFRFAPDRPGLWTLVFYVSVRGGDQARPGGSAVIVAEPAPPDAR